MTIPELNPRRPEPPPPPPPPPAESPWSRYVLIALLLALLGGGALVYRELVRAPGGADWKAPLVAGSGAEGALGFSEIIAFLRSKRGDPTAERFAAAFLAKPGLKAAWEEFVAGGEKNDIDDLLGKLQGNEELGEVLEQFADDPGFQQLVEGLGRDPRFAKAVRKGGRMFLAGLEGGAGAPGGVSGARDLNSGSARAAAGFTRIFSFVEPRARARVLQRLEEGLPPWDACRRAQALPECQNAYRRCQTEPSCAPWLKTAEASAGLPEKGTGGTDVRTGPGARGDYEEPPPGPPPSTDGSGGGGGGGTGGDTGSGTVTVTGIDIEPPTDSCGNGRCQPGIGETCGNCRVDCGRCSGSGGVGPATSTGTGTGTSPLTGTGTGTGTGTRAKASPTCGNGVCDGGELCSTCRTDCGACVERFPKEKPTC